MYIFSCMYINNLWKITRDTDNIGCVGEKVKLEIEEK